MAASGFTYALKAGLILAISGVACLSLVMAVDNFTRYRTSSELDARQRQQFELLLPHLKDRPGVRVQCRLVSDPRVGQHRRLLIAELDGQPEGYVLSYETAMGYSNPLVLVAGFTRERRLTRVDIEISNETPGIGDKVDRHHGNFLEMLNDKALGETRFDVTKFGGDFDYITGATVTSRAVVVASGQALEVMTALDPERLPRCKL